MARIVDEASLACCQRVVARRRRRREFVLGSPPAKRDSGEALAFPAFAEARVAGSSGARVPRATVAGSSARGAAKPVALKIHLMCETPQKATHRWCNGAMPRRTDRAR